jgi:ribosomal protein S18 acetylase RimI-like enzyme
VVGPDRGVDGSPQRTIAMVDVTLIPLTEEEREAFLEAEIADHADQQVRDAGWPRSGAAERARAELEPLLEREHAEAAARADRLWSAIEPSGTTVGWLWVKSIDDLPPRAAFLEQVTVARGARRRGYGRAMLAAVEELLARDGIDEIRLTVSRANEPARRLYGAAGYEPFGGDERECFMRKRL